MVPTAAAALAASRPALRAAARRPLSAIAPPPAAAAAAGDGEGCSYAAADRAHALHPYASMTDPAPVHAVASASGPHLHLEDGRTVIDGMSSWWAAVHGYRHPALDGAVRAQLDRMAHVMFGGLTHRPAAELAARLADLVPAPLTKVFLCDSGSVSVEVALKMALQYHHATGSPGRTRFVSLRNGYHGDTFGAMSVCDPVGGMHSMFSGVLARQRFVDGPSGPACRHAQECASRVEAVLASEEGGDVAAVIFEPVVQGAGGMRFHHPALLRAVREACDRHGVLLILDEIATGFGRTGTMFAHEQDGRTFRPWYSSAEGGELGRTESDGGGEGEGDGSAPVVPDILCLGKALTGGYMTLGATMTTERVAEGISGGGGVFMHGPTFMGNPLACAAALASLDLLEGSPWRERVGAVRDALVRSMAPAASIESVREVRVLGAIGVCELERPVSDMAAVQEALLEEGVWLRPFGRLLYTMPTFNCPELTEDHVRRIGEAICKVAAMEAYPEGF